MGMPGMTDAAAAAYAAAKAPEKAKGSGETVAEFRNKVNPVTGYYDRWDAEGFLKDQSIPLETKIEALFGTLVAKVVAEYGTEKLAELGKALIKDKED